MPSVDDAARLALTLPEVTEAERHGNRTWYVGGKAFAWLARAPARLAREFAGQ